MKFTHKVVNKASDWLLKRESTTKTLVYKPVCETHYELSDFAMNLQTSKQSLEHLGQKEMVFFQNV